jgi:Dullard-like phosphatase family protein
MLEEYILKEGNLNKCDASPMLSSASTFLDEFPKKESNYEQFLKETSKLDFNPITINENIPGNYDNYVGIALSHIAKMKNINFNNILDLSIMKENILNKRIERFSNNNKKILLLDLDETLIHADFKEEFLNSNEKYDEIITFYSVEEPFPSLEESNKNEDDTESNMTDDESKDENENKNENINKVGIFLRTGVIKFLEEVSKYFEVGIFTASVREYADAVINFLDPENKYIKYRLYRNSCINVGDLVRVKNLRILKNISLKDIVLVDNNMYSFAPQLDNGILINSFFCDKKDNELENVLSYLIEFILPSDDVRKTNEQFFGFKRIVEDMSKKYERI